MKTLFCRVPKRCLTSFSYCHENIHIINQGGRTFKNVSVLKDSTPISASNKYMDQLLIRNFCKDNFTNCWNCNSTTSNKLQFFCDSCGMIQNANKNLDFFKILSLEENFGIDSTKLTRKFRQLQNLLHPDKYGNSSEKEQINSEEWSSLINKAYKTLQKPIERGEYLLKLKGVTMPKDNSALDKEFLMEMMERNEEIEDAASNDLDELLNRVRNDMNTENIKLGKEFETQNYDKAKSILVKMKYLRSIEKSIKDKLEKQIEIK